MVRRIDKLLHCLNWIRLMFLREQKSTKKTGNVSYMIMYFIYLYIFWQSFSMGEEWYYTSVSVRVQERTATQKWQNEEMVALICLKNFEKRIKNLSIRKPNNTNTHWYMLFSKPYTNVLQVFKKTRQVLSMIVL